MQSEKDVVSIYVWDEMRSYDFVTEKKVNQFCVTCGRGVYAASLDLWKAAGDVI